MPTLTEQANELTNDMDGLDADEPGAFITFALALPSYSGNDWAAGQVHSRPTVGCCPRCNAGTYSCPCGETKNFMCECFPPEPMYCGCTNVLRRFINCSCNCAEPVRVERIVTKQFDKRFDRHSLVRPAPPSNQTVICIV